MLTCSSKQLIRCQLHILVNTKPICLQSLGCVAIDVMGTGATKENKIIMHDLYVQTLTSNLLEGFNRNFFDQDRWFYSKNWISRIIEIRKITKIFTINNSIKRRDREQSSKNPVFFKNRHSNHWVLTVSLLEISLSRYYHHQGSNIMIISPSWNHIVF